MQQEVRFATFNVRNLALPGVRFYENVPPYSDELFEDKIDWVARMIEHGLPEPLALELIHLVLIVVTLSILLHGITSKPLMHFFWRKTP